MSEPKLCRDCRHARPFNNMFAWLRGERWRLARCRAELEFPNRQLTDGLVRRDDMGFCAVARIHDDDCGPEGKLFEPKQGRGA
jgi:hypothetical protein